MNQDDVLALLRERGPMTAREVWEGLDAPEYRVRDKLGRLMKWGIVDFKPLKAKSKKDPRKLYFVK